MIITTKGAHMIRFSNILRLCIIISLNVTPLHCSGKQEENSRCIQRITSCLSITALLTLAGAVGIAGTYVRHIYNSPADSSITPITLPYISMLPAAPQPIPVIMPEHLQPLAQYTQEQHTSPLITKLKKRKNIRQAALTPSDQQSHHQ